MNDDDRPPTEPLDESTPLPTALDLDRTEDLTATWPDGVTTRYSLEALRVNCACAGFRSGPSPRRPSPSGPTTPSSSGHGASTSPGTTATRPASSRGRSS